MSRPTYHRSLWLRRSPCQVSAHPRPLSREGDSTSSPTSCTQFGRSDRHSFSLRSQTTLADQPMAPSPRRCRDQLQQPRLGTPASEHYCNCNLQPQITLDTIGAAIGHVHAAHHRDGCQPRAGVHAAAPPPRTPAQTKASLSELNYARPDFPRGLGLIPSECARAPRRMYYGFEEPNGPRFPSRFHLAFSGHGRGMALSKLSGDEAGVVFTQLCNVLEPRDAVDFSSVSNELRTATQALLQQLRADHEAAIALCHKVGLRSCKELREAKKLGWFNTGLSGADLALLGTLGPVLPALEQLILSETSGSAGLDGVQRLAEGLGAGALPAVTILQRISMHMGDAGAMALAAALGRGTLPRLETLFLSDAAIGDAGLVALAPALRRRPALERLFLNHNPLGDEGLAALVAPPPTGALPPSTGGLANLKLLNLTQTQITDAGCATLVAALESGALPALETLHLFGIPASVAAKAALREAAKSRAAVSEPHDAANATTRQSALTTTLPGATTATTGSVCICPWTCSEALLRKKASYNLGASSLTTTSSCSPGSLALACVTSTSTALVCSAASTARK
eukprot:scaffold72916_cov67-Phaeocystis_antarctica.AAC.3